MPSLEDYFSPYREQIIGQDVKHDFAFECRPILYADWAASGRLYRPIESFIMNALGPYVANTHTETTTTGSMMTSAYHQAHDIIKTHVNASEEDVLLFAGFGMTAVINKFQRILGLRVPEQHRHSVEKHLKSKPLILLTHMEHHSNQTTWEECLCDVALIHRAENGLPDLDHLETLLRENQHRLRLIGSFSACSNVTGIMTPYHEMAELMHAYGGLCFIDFSASAPYVQMNMHPEKESQRLDAIFFSPHKFLGGPGSSGVILFNKSLYDNPVPDHPGGGTVLWTNPWGGHKFYDNIEIREDGGTPGFLQAIKASLAILLKETMGVEMILLREHELKTRLLQGLRSISGLHILEPHQDQRLGYFSFFAEGMHHNLLVKLLNDRFGIQTRGGCSCAGTLGHILLNIDSKKSRQITDQIDQGDLSQKPGWVRVSLHPTMTEEDVDVILTGIREVKQKGADWGKEYRFNQKTGDFDRLKTDEKTIDLKQSVNGFGGKYRQ